jgi:hypothetical protein
VPAVSADGRGAHGLATHVAVRERDAQIRSALLEELETPWHGAETRDFIYDFAARLGGAV